MSTFQKIQSTTSAQLEAFRFVRPTIAVAVSRRKLDGSGIVNLKNFEDDLGEFEADFLLVEEVPVVIQRYMSNAENEYNVFVDTDKAFEQGTDPWKISEVLATAVGVEGPDIVWKNQELQILLEEQKQKRPSSSVDA